MSLALFFLYQSKFEEEMLWFIGFCFADNTVNIDPFALKDLLPDNTDVFYRYTGSLTTPHCNEVVAWTLFKDTVKISENQVLAS